MLGFMTQIQILLVRIILTVLLKLILSQVEESTTGMVNQEIKERYYGI